MSCLNLRGPGQSCQSRIRVQIVSWRLKYWMLLGLLKWTAASSEIFPSFKLYLSLFISSSSCLEVYISCFLSAVSSFYSWFIAVSCPIFHSSALSWVSVDFSDVFCDLHLFLLTVANFHLSVGMLSHISDSSLSSVLFWCTVKIEIFLPWYLDPLVARLVPTVSPRCL